MASTTDRGNDIFGTKKPALLPLAGSAQRRLSGQSSAQLAIVPTLILWEGSLSPIFIALVVQLVLSQGRGSVSLPLFPTRRGTKAG